MTVVDVGSAMGYFTLPLAELVGPTGRVVAVDLQASLPYLEQTTSDYGVEVMKAWNAVVSLTGNPELNPQSPAQLTEAFAKRGIRLTTTEAAELKKLDDDLARAILHYREVKKLHTTYLKGLLSEQRGGLIHPNFNLDGARTGRMSSGAAKE